MPAAGLRRASLGSADEPYLAVAWREARWIASASLRIVLALLLQFSFFFSNVMSVSHLGAAELAAMALSVTFFVVVAMAPMAGLISAMDTFCSNALTASSDRTMVGVHLQRGLAALAVHFALVAPAMWNAEQILLLIGQDPPTARLCGTYLRIQILGVVPWVAFEACRRYLQAQGVMGAGTVVAAAVAAVHWAASYLLVRSSTYGIGFVGAPVVTVASQWLSLVGILAYIRARRATETWGGWDARALRNMGEFYRLAIPSVAMVCAEWGGRELLTLGASYFGAAQLAGSTVMSSTVNLVFQVTNSLGFSVGPRVGNLIGAARPRQARIAADVSVAMSALACTLATVLLVALGGWWISVFTGGPAVAHEAARLVPATCMFLVSGGLNTVLGAVLRGLGRQAISACTYTAGYYACAAPVGFYLGFWRDMGAAGAWWGMCSGAVLSSTVQLACIYLWIDWGDEVQRCMLRLRRSDPP